MGHKWPCRMEWVNLLVCISLRNNKQMYSTVCPRMAINADLSPMFFMQLTDARKAECRRTVYKTADSRLQTADCTLNWFISISTQWTGRRTTEILMGFIFFCLYQEFNCILIHKHTHQSWALPVFFLF